MMSMKTQHDAEDPQQDEQEPADGQIGRRGLLAKGAAAAVGMTAGVFVSPRLTPMNLSAHAASLIPATVSKP
jgi:hypothetical protein